MKKSAQIILQIFIDVATVLTLSAGKAMAFSVQEGAEAARADGMPAELVGPQGAFTNITNTILYVIGIISVIMLVWGGVRYITSGGDNKKVTDAKNTVLYAIIGLIISVLAYAIVNFVLNTIGVSDYDLTESPTPVEQSQQ